MRQLVSRLILIHILGQSSGQQADYEDYCALLGEDDIQGLKHGFLAGNKVYYMGGKLQNYLVILKNNQSLSC